jgi:hypothetical protein
MTSVLLIAWQAAHFDFMRTWFINRTTHRVVKSSREREFPHMFVHLKEGIALGTFWAL